MNQYCRYCAYCIGETDYVNVENGRYKPREKKVDNGQGSLF